jgi:hypothetical protein
MRQASWAGNISVVLQPFLKWKRGVGKETTNVSAAEENKAIFRRYAEEAGNQQNFEIVDEIFERYISHQPDGSTLVRSPEDVKRFHREFHSAFSEFHIDTTCGMLQAVSQTLDSLLARRGARASERNVVGSHPCQHVRHLLLRHPRPQER